MNNNIKMDLIQNAAWEMEYYWFFKERSGIWMDE